MRAFQDEGAFDFTQVRRDIHRKKSGVKVV